MVSLVTWVHGHPAELVAGYVVLHVGPDWLPHDRDRVLPGKIEQLLSWVYLNPLTEELTCIGIIIIISGYGTVDTSMDGTLD